MPPIKLEDSYLADQFNDFYHEVIRIKRELPAMTAAAVRQEHPEEDPQGAGATTDAIQQRLLALLEKQALDAARRGGEYGAGLYKEAQYVMVALADEIFLNAGWEGRDAWEANLLEEQLFGSYVAGEQFFQRLERLLKAGDAAHTGLALIYLMALSLGFSGKYRDRDDGGQLNFYRRQLFAFIFHRNPDLMNASRRICPEAYGHTLDQAEGKRFPHIGRWVALLVCMFIGYIVIAHGLWSRLTGEMATLVQQFLR